MARDAPDAAAGVELTTTTPGLVCGHHPLYSTLARGMPPPPERAADVRALVPHRFAVRDVIEVVATPLRACGPTVGIDRDRGDAPQIGLLDDLGGRVLRRPLVRRRRPLAAAGLTFGFALQTFIIVGGVLRVVPLTGITLPFVSYGGTSIVANFVMLALLLLVSNRANAPR